MPNLPLFVFLTLCVGFSLAASAQEGAMVTLERSEGEVVVQRAGSAAWAENGQKLAAGAWVRSAAGGRVELSVDGSPTLALGNGAELVVESVTERPLRLRLVRGAAHVDTRAQGDRPRRDLLLQLGEVGLHVNGGEVWAALNNEIAQICLMSGGAEAQIQNRVDRLELPGQCLSRAGLESRWVMVPAEVLTERTALLHVRVRDSIVGRAGAPDPHKLPPAIEPPPRPLPMPVPVPVPVPVPTPAPAAVEAVATNPTSATPAPTTTAVPAKPPVRDEPSVPAVASTDPVPAPSSFPPPEAPPAPAAKAEGSKHWSVVLASLDTIEAAEIEAARLRKQGVSAEVREYVLGDRRGYRVGHGRFNSRAEAQAAYETLRRRHPKLSGWMASY